ncbi:MAG: hypothetical protein IT376_12255, partial [Polyangiaceae bacterium]|nr:hypothetical protein [Polyangiaceae bacterium]
AKRLCEEVPYLDATGRFEAGDCPGGAVGRCTSEPSYGRRDYYYVGFGGFEDPDQVAMVASVICDHEWEELAP